MDNHSTNLPEELLSLLPAYMANQRWYPRSSPPERVTVRESDLLAECSRGRMFWAVVNDGRSDYQILVGQSTEAEVSGIRGEVVPIGTAGGQLFYDALSDHEMATALYDIVAGDGIPHRVRPIGAEQSNTSLIFDDRVILKVFRRLVEGPNPDVEVTTALALTGFSSLAMPAGSWRRDNWDLAFAQQYLVGGSEGWSLALTSLRDLYASRMEDPRSSGGDYAAEASRLGQMTAEMHLAMADAFGVDAMWWETHWSSYLDELQSRLVDVLNELGISDRGEADRLMERLRLVSNPGLAIRVHGDYHLGQVMRTDAGWHVLDFEGEPARPLAERRAPSSPLKDVSGMARSFHYAAQSAIGERAEPSSRLEALALAWERHNRAAFFAGYVGTKGIDALLPSDVGTLRRVGEAFELDKALYELHYEKAYRPELEHIPFSAIRRLLSSRSESEDEMWSLWPGPGAPNEVDEAEDNG